MQEHLYVSLIRKSLLVREILGSLDIGHREPPGNGLQGNSPPRLAGLQRAFHDLRGRFRMPVPPLGLCSFGAERWNRDLLFGHAHFPSKYICCCGLVISQAVTTRILPRRSVYRIVSNRPDLVRPKQSTRSSLSCGCTSASNRSIRTASSASFGLMPCLAMCCKLSASQSNSIIYMVNTW